MEEKRKALRETRSLAESVRDATMADPIIIDTGLLSSALSSALSSSSLPRTRFSVASRRTTGCNKFVMNKNTNTEG